MPNFEYEFSNQDRQLVVDQAGGVFGDTLTDYIRLTIYPTEAINNIVTLPGTDKQAIFYSSLNPIPFNINISPFGIGTDIFDTYTIGGVAGENDFKIYKNGDDVYIKPNEIFNKFELPQGDYKIQIDFLNQVSPPFFEDPNEQNQDPNPTSNSDNHYQFIIKQISTSRKEVRLRLFDRPMENNSQTITNLTNEFNNNQPEFLDGTPNPNYKYQFKHILNIGTGNHIPIMNYQFDSVTGGKDNQTIILKLYEPLPTNVGNLSMVTIEKEVLITQTEDIYYFSDVPDVFFGDGLLVDDSQNWINSDGNNINFQNYDEISGSIDDITLDSLISSSDNYPNLNTNFNEFSNHTFFGSAKKKLVNFKNKVETIQGHYSDISKSLYSDGITISGDSSTVTQNRKNLFKKINDEIKTFTPYEYFLYYDGQNESTASAPGLGEDYAHTIPLRTTDNYEQLNGHDGFNVVYKNSNVGFVQGEITLFNNVYKAQDKPFFNYSSSVYLSFILKGTTSASLDRSITNDNVVGATSNGFFLPKHTAYTASLQQPLVTGSEYRRYIFEASQSYFSPLSPNTDMSEISVLDFIDASKFEILHGSVKTGSNKMSDLTNRYPTTVITQSGVPFFGSVMPAGDLFAIALTSGSALTQSFITDVRVSLKNPTNTLPFDNLYLTSSAEWTNWYSGVLTKAENFDTDNIHSLENNLPLYIQGSGDYNDMKDFLSLQGEQYDLIRNHIDSLGTLHDRGYKKTNSPPDNTLPMLLNNMGWEAINPFSGSLTDSLGSYLTGVTSIDDIKNNTWRKTLNNLLYIYKSKGTKNSVRALLNVYGYPPDVLQINEFGGSTENQIGNGENQIITDNPPATSSLLIDLDLSTSTGSFSFLSSKQKLYRYIADNKSDRILNLDWWMDNADINTIEFVYKHKKTTNTQTILKSSGSGTENLWDLILVPSTLGESSSFEFRLNNSQDADTSISSRGFSMSLDYNNMTDGQLWNILVQRMTGSTSGKGTIEYRLHSSLQNEKIIEKYSYATMSISGGTEGGTTEGGKGFFANYNFQGTASRHYLSSSNLFVGETCSGSLAEMKAWSTALSISRFRQHTLNKFSTVGNTIDSHRKELVYHFKLNENYLSASVSASDQNLTIVDSAAKCNLTTDYSFTKLGGLFTSSVVYGFDIIDIGNFTVQNNLLQENDNNIIINPGNTILGNLNPNQLSIDSLTNPFGRKPKLITSTKLELYRSPQDFVNDFILNRVDSFNLENYYGNPIYYKSSSYTNFDTLKNEFFDCNPIEVDTNKFIRSHESMINNSLGEGLKTLAPARSTLSDKNSNFGVMIKPTILEKQKYEHHKHSIEANPNSGLGTINVNILKLSDKLGNKELLTIYDSVKEGTALINLQTTSSVDLPKIASISVDVTNTATYEKPKIGLISPLPSLTDSLTLTSKNGTINYASIANKSYTSVHSNWGTANTKTHFINYNDTGSDGEYNTYAIDTRFVFHSIGDTEIYSGSRESGSHSGAFEDTDFSNYKRFFNRTMITNNVNSKINYESLINGTPGLQNGRMMGKTRYFFTASDGTIILPSNHISKFSQPFKETLNKGTQNTNPGILNVNQEDYSSASFYRVKVTGGENILKVGGGKSTINPDNDRIMPIN